MVYGLNLAVFLLFMYKIEFALYYFNICDVISTAFMNRCLYFLVLYHTCLKNPRNSVDTQGHDYKCLQYGGDYQLQVNSI